MNSHELLIKDVAVALTDAYPYETPMFANIRSLEMLTNVYKALNSRYPPQTLFHCLKGIYNKCETDDTDPELINHVRSFLESAEQVERMCSLFLPTVSDEEAHPLLKYTEEQGHPLLKYTEEQGHPLMQQVAEQGQRIEEILARLSTVEKHVQDLQFYCF